MDLVLAVKNLDPTLLSKLLSEENDLSSIISSVSLFHELIETFNDKPKFQQDGAQLVYILSNYRIDINKQDQWGNTAFHHYLYNADFLHPDVTEAFLRCSADVFVKNMDGVSVVDRLREYKLPKDITDLCLKYMPGLWNAVESDDINSVRKLVNQWCKVDIQKEGKSLVQLALEKGTEDIIRIMSGIKVSVAIAHGVLAGDIDYVKRLLSGKDKYNVNFKNMGDRSATPLYYAACQNNTEMISLLLSYGARLDMYMTYQEFDIPTYFSLMLEYPVVDVSTLKTILPIKPVPIDKMYYQGRNVLFHCVDCDIHTDIIEEILQQCSAEIVTQRIQNDMTVRDYAEANNCDNVISIIDKYVNLWWHSKDLNTHKQILILHGYLDIPHMIQGPSNDPVEDIPSDDSNIEEYLNRVADFHEAVEMCDVDKVKELIYCDNCINLQSCLADSRIQGKGQPALHKAILRKDIETCNVIAEAMVYHCKQKLDSMRDQYFRTALHYAYGMVDGKEFVETLVDYGSSEFTVDKDGRSPLAFKDRQELQQMKDLLQYQLLQDFTEAEPDPWSLRLPMPVVGYLMDCAHSKHKHLSLKLAEKIAVELNPIGHSHHDGYCHGKQSNVKHNANVHTHSQNSTNHRQICSSDTEHWRNESFGYEKQYSMLERNSTNSDSCDATDNAIYNDESSDEDDDDSQLNSSSSCIIL